MNLKIYDDSKNYTCQVIKLPPKIPIKGLDNLVEVNVQGNSVLISKDSPEDELYLFFPSECKLSQPFLALNNLYKHENLNIDPTEKPGFFEDNGRVKAIKFRGIISSGFVIPAKALFNLFSSKEFTQGAEQIVVGAEFNEFNGIEICRKYIRRTNPGKAGFQNPKTARINNLVDGKQVPEHIDTSHLMKNLHKLSADTRIIVSYKLHGTSARTFRTLVKRKLNWKEKVAKFFGVRVVEEDYDYVVGSRRMIKSIGLEELPGKNHYYTSGDLWSEVAKKFYLMLNKGEAVYYEIIGRTSSGEEIQSGYSYGKYEPCIYVYRISNINPDGIEVDLSQEQMEARCRQMGLQVCPVLFKGTVLEFIHQYGQKYITSCNIHECIEKIFYNDLLEQPSIFDRNVVEEGFCIKIEEGIGIQILKAKSKKFLAHESKVADKGAVDMEEEQTQEDGERSSTSDL